MLPRAHDHEMIYKNISYSVVTQSIIVVLSIVSMAVLGRLLEPTTFGVFALLFSVHNLLIPLVDFGLTPVYLKKEKITQETKNVFFTLNLILGVLYGILFWGVATFMLETDVAKYSPVFIISTLLFAYNQQNIANLTRQQNQKSLMFINLLSTITATAIAIVIAYLGYQIYALLMQQLAKAAIATVITKKISPHKFKLTNKKTIQSYREDIIFSITIMGSRIINGISLTYDKFLVNNFFGLTVLGYYSRTFELSRYPNASIGAVVSTPILAYLARKPANEARKLYPAVSNLVFFLTANILLFLVLFGDWFIVFLLGPNWYDAGIFMQLLSIWGIGKIFHGLLITIYTNEKLMILFTKFSIAALLINITVFLTTYITTLNATQTIGSFALSNLIIWFVLYLYSIYYFSHQKGIVESLKFIVLNCTAFTTTIYFLKVAYFDQSTLKFILGPVIYFFGMFATIILLYVIDKKMLLGLRDLKE